MAARDHGSPARFTAQPVAVHIAVLPSISESAYPTDESIPFLSAPPGRLTVSTRTPPSTVLYYIEIAPKVPPQLNWTFSLVGKSVSPLLTYLTH